MNFKGLFSTILLVYGFAVLFFNKVHSLSNIPSIFGIAHNSCQLREIKTGVTPAEAGAQLFGNKYVGLTQQKVDQGTIGRDKSLRYKAVSLMQCSSGLQPCRGLNI